jgi:hypothetical protein
MQLGVYAHPWDLRALASRGGLGRLRELGFHEVALAASYHAGRWLVPWSAPGMVRFLEDGVVHFRPEGDYGELRPLPSAEVAAGPSPLQQLCDEASVAGVRARAWTVLFHNSRLGELHLGSTVENAFGDRYSYALCPARPEVRAYALALIADVCRHQGLHAIELEASGWMGHRHNSHHDKSSFAPEPFTDALLSLCFCDVCRSAVATDVRGLREKVSGLLAHAFGSGCAMSPEQRTPAVARTQLQAGLGEGPLQALLRHRTATMQSLLDEARRIAAAAGVRLCLQTAYDPLQASLQQPVAELGSFADEVAVTTYGQGPDGVEKALPLLVAARAGCASLPLRLCLHPHAPHYRNEADLHRILTMCREHDVATIALYHLGLLPWRTIERAASALRA